MYINLVVTKKISFFAYLIKKGLVPFDVELKEYVTRADMIGRHVMGDNLPYCLSCCALSYTEIPLRLPAELAGQRLILSDYEKYAAKPVTYLIISTLTDKELS